MTFVGGDNRHDLPKVSYSTALDYFVAVCFGFVLATIIQFAAVHFYTKRNSGEPVESGDGIDELDVTDLVSIQTVSEAAPLYCLFVMGG